MRLIALVVLAGLLGVGCGRKPEQAEVATSPQLPEAEANLPKLSPEEVVKAWKDAGAQLWWMTTLMDGNVDYLETPVPDSVPVFHFYKWRAGTVSKLPLPEHAFGLRIFSTTAIDAFGQRIVLSTLTDAGLQELTRLKNLAALDLSDTQVTSDGLKVLAPLKQLVYLKLSDRIATDSTLRELREIGLLHALPRAVAVDGKRPSKPDEVTTLELGGTQVTDAGLKELASLKNVVKINLYRTRVSDAGPKALAHLKRLSYLDLSSTGVADAGLKELASSKQLLHLDLSDTRVSDAGLKELAPLTQLVHLNLWDTRVTGAGLKEIAPLKQLVCLILPAQAVNDATLRTLREIGLLHTLSWASTADRKRPANPDGVTRIGFSPDCEVTDVGLKELAPLKNLSSLHLQHTRVTDAALKDLAPLKNLTLLELPDRALTDTALRSLREIGLLHALSRALATPHGKLPTQDGSRPTKADDITLLILIKATVTDAGLKELAGLTNLMSLYLAETKVTDVGLRELVPLTKLTCLDLSKTQVTDAGLKELLRLTNLTELGLYEAKVTDAGVAEFQKAMPNCKIKR